MQYVVNSSHDIPSELGSDLNVSYTFDDNSTSTQTIFYSQTRSGKTQDQFLIDYGNAYYLGIQLTDGIPSPMDILLGHV